METYKKKLKRKVIFQSVCTVIAIVLVVLSFLRFQGMDSNEHQGSYFQGFQIGLFTVWAVVMILGIVIDIRAVRNEERLKKLYIKENDERTKTITTEAQARAYRASLFIIVAAAVISGFYSFSVFITLVGATVFLSVMGCIMGIYMNHQL